jgi:hypothetical protein
MSLEFLLLSPRFNSFLLLEDEQNSKCVWGGGGMLAVIKYTYLPPGSPDFIQDIEDWCSLLTSSSRFVDLPISGTSDDRKASYGPKSMHIFIMSEIRQSQTI